LSAKFASLGKPRNIIIVVADSLRYDSVYRNGSIGAPYLEKNAIHFSQARSSGCWTLPATSCLFSGKVPHEHGATSQTRRILDEVPTIAEKLKSAGYNTYQITANIATTGVFGLDRGFDEVIKIWQEVDARFNRLVRLGLIMGKARVRAALLSKDKIMNQLFDDIENGNVWAQNTYLDIFDRARKKIEENEKKNEGSFIFINLMESHFPYHIAPTFRFAGEGLISRIQESYHLYHFVNQTFLNDDKLPPPKMMQRIKERQQESWRIIQEGVDSFCQEMHEDKENLVIFCSDHGDNFGEMNWVYHFSNVNDAGNRVPLMWLGHEAQEPKTIDTPVSSRFIYHSILEKAGLDNEGGSLFDERAMNLPILSSYWYNNKGKTQEKYKYNQIAFVHENQRFVWRKGKWLTAPITKGKDYEAEFVEMDKGSDPIEEFVKDTERKSYLKQKLHDFKIFDEIVMAKSMDS
jgi:hypothetical protein